jgi:hypothetical protein
MTAWYDDDEGVRLNKEEAAEVVKMTEELNERRRGDWVREALAQYPQAAPLRDLIQGPTREAVLDVAKGIAERLGDTGTADATSHARMNAGQPARDSNADARRQRLEEQKARYRRGDESAFAEFLRDRFEEQGAQYPGRAR